MGRERHPRHSLALLVRPRPTVVSGSNHFACSSPSHRFLPTRMTWAEARATRRVPPRAASVRGTNRRSHVVATVRWSLRHRREETPLASRVNSVGVYFFWWWHLEVGFDGARAGGIVVHVRELGMHAPRSRWERKTRARSCSSARCVHGRTREAPRRTPRTARRALLTRVGTQVWADNLEEEMAMIREVVDQYQYVAMDTEFPGVVARPVHSTKVNEYQYQTLRCNVDMLKLIQLGLTFCDEDGNLPSFDGKHMVIWQFNFRCVAPNNARLHV